MPDPTAPANEDPTTLALIQQFRRCAHLMRHTSSHGGGTRILIKLLLNGPVTQRALADLLERTPATLSQQLEPLERDGLVERAPWSPTGAPWSCASQKPVLPPPRRRGNETSGWPTNCSAPLNGADRRDLLRILATLEASWRTRPTAPETQGSR